MHRDQIIFDLITEEKGKTNQWFGVNCFRELC